ncbi:MAG TPA: NAD(P)H-dependent oxidoreductase [Thermomicrobiales bacterium]|nr:NAD(P)H-dependent oxidoreductase [Thermomicrobiales bacterium]
MSDHPHDDSARSVRSLLKGVLNRSNGAPGHGHQTTPADTTPQELLRKERQQVDPVSIAASLGTPPDRPLRILGFGGTTSEQSWSLIPLERALAVAESAGCETTLATVHQLDLPLFRTDWRLEDYPDTLAWFIDEVRRADGLIICSPTYHGTISGAIKNVLDMLIFLAWDDPPYLGGKPVGVMSYGGMTSMGVLDALNTCVRGLKGITVPTQVAVPESAIYKPEAAIFSQRILDRIDGMVADVISFSARLRVPHHKPNAISHASTSSPTG